MPPPEDRRSPSQETIDNTVAIGKLATISERTTKDVDRLVRHIENFLPVHEKLLNIKKILYSACALGLVFVIWMTTEHYSVSSKVDTDIAVKDKEIVKLKSRVSKMENYQNRNYGFLQGQKKEGE